MVSNKNSYFTIACCAFHSETVFPLRCTTAQYHQTSCAALSHSRALPTF